MLDKILNGSTILIRLLAVVMCVLTNSPLSAQLSESPGKGTTVRQGVVAEDTSVKTDAAVAEHAPMQGVKLVQMRKDPTTGKLLAYNYIRNAWDPYQEAYKPDGADYFVTNEGETILITYDQGVEVRTRNYGYGLAVRMPDTTGDTWVEARGAPVYYDRQKKIWWSHQWGAWSFSADNGKTWLETPHVELRFVERPTGQSRIDFFDSPTWVRKAGELEFLDKRYPKSGFHRMSEFFPHLHDGKGYDGEPLVVIDSWKKKSDARGVPGGAIKQAPRDKGRVYSPIRRNP